MPVLDAVQTFAGISNENEFYSHHYLAEVFTGDIREQLEAWDADEALLPAEILDRTGLELAYTSIATVLTRLLEKGLVSREPDGRAFRYRPAFGEGELAAQRIAVILSHTTDRRGALAGFVNGLGKRDAATLRALLDGGRK